jgi:hypothetical protein
VPSNLSFFYVDPVNGNDNNPAGSPAQPWRTLTFALCVTAPGKTIQAFPGVYSAATNGEQFPLNVRGQRLNSTTAQGAIIEGVGLVAGDNIQATFDIQMSTTTSNLKGFRINGSPGNEGVGVLVRDGAGIMTLQIENLTVFNHTVGVHTKGSTVEVDFFSSMLTANEVNVLASDQSTLRMVGVVMEMGLTGLRVIEQADVNVRFSAATGSGMQNVEISSPNVDLGTVGSTGMNSFQGAAGVNIWNRTNGTIDAVGNTLDARPVTQSNTNPDDGGENIANEFFPQGCVRVQAGDCP